MDGDTSKNDKVQKNLTIPILSRISNQELQVVCKHVGAAIISYLKSLEYCI